MTFWVSAKWVRQSRLFDLYQKSDDHLGTKKTRGFFGFLLLGWLIFAFFPSTTFWLDSLIMDGWQKAMLHVRPTDGGVVVVAIDTETLEFVKERWPWPRAQLAKLVEAIGEGRPQFIMLDILLQHPESQSFSPGDETLEQVFKKLGNVVLIAIAEEMATPMGKQVRLFRCDQRFRKAAAIEGYLWGFIDPDYRIRSVVFRDDRFEIDNCLVQMVQKRDPSFQLPGKWMDVPERFQIAFAQKEMGIPIVSAMDLLNRSIDPKILKNKLVILGMTAMVLHDYHQTSLGLVSGPEIQGVALDTLLTHRITQRLDSFPARFFFGLFGWVIGILLMEWYFPTKRIIPFLVPPLLLLAGFFGGDAMGVVFPWGPFLLAMGFAILFLWLVDYFFQFIQIQLIKGEAQQAREIQAVLFPQKSWSSKGYLCRGLCIPCDEVGGDYFDFFQQNEGQFMFVIADVTGHGVSAAMVTTVAKSVVMLLEKWEILNPYNLILTLNSIVFNLLNRKKVLTIMAGQIDLETGNVLLSAAGHLPAILVRKDGTWAEYGIPSTPIGLREKYPLKTLEFQMNPGDHLLLYTDGIVEATDWSDEQFGYQEWLDFVKSNLRCITPETDLETIPRTISKLIGERKFGDDVTLLLLQRLE